MPKGCYPRTKKLVGIRPAIRVIGPSIAYVQLTHGHLALIDAWRSDWADRYTWGSKTGDGLVYAIRSIFYMEDGKEKCRVTRMHRELFEAATGLIVDIVDHRNGNSLDNRDTNLREASPAQSSANQKLRKDSGTGLKGVGLHKPSGLYYARISFNHKIKHLGYFKLKEAAGEAYRKEALEMHGEYSGLRRPQLCP